MKKDICCETMKNKIRDEVISRYETPEVYFIYGKPEFVNDGDDYWDDMTESFEIFWCPFCGKKLK